MIHEIRMIIFVWTIQLALWIAPSKQKSLLTLMLTDDEKMFREIFLD